MKALDRRQIEMVRACRDALLRTARSERAHGCREAVALLVRTARADHRRLIGLLRASRQPAALQGDLFA